MSTEKNKKKVEVEGKVVKVDALVTTTTKLTLNFLKIEFNPKKDELHHKEKSIGRTFKARIYKQNIIDKNGNPLDDAGFKKLGLRIKIKNKFKIAEVIIKFPNLCEHNEYFKEEEIFKNEAGRLESVQNATAKLPDLYFGKLANVIAHGHVTKVSTNTEENLFHCTKKTPILIEEYMDGVSLQELLHPDHREDENKKDFYATLFQQKNHTNTKDSMDNWFYFAFALTNTIRRLHNKGVIHGAIEPRHIIICEDEPRENYPNEKANLPTLYPSLVGFGTSALLQDQSQIELVKKHVKDSIYAAPELKLSGRFDSLYSFPQDIYALGMVLLELAMVFTHDGRQTDLSPKEKAPAEKEKKTENYKDLLEMPERIESLKRKVNDLIYPVEFHADSQNTRKISTSDHIFSISKIIDKAIRHDPEDRYSCADEMMDFIYNGAPQHIKEILAREPLLQFVEKERLRLNNSSNGKDEGPPPCFFSLIYGNDKIYDIIERLLNPSKSGNDRSPRFNPIKTFSLLRLKNFLISGILSALNDHYEVYGSRDNILDAVCDFIGLLNPGDDYDTLSIPSYWTNENLGSNGRFLVKNIDLAVTGGVNIRRIFLVSSDFDDLPFEEQMVLWHQLQSVRKVENLTGQQNGKEIVTGSMQVRIKRVERDHIKSLELRSSIVAYFKFKSQEKVEVTPEIDSIVGLSFMSHGYPRNEYDKEFWKMVIKKARFKILWDNCISEPKDRQDHTLESFVNTWNNDTMPLEEYLKRPPITLDKLFSTE